jgi:hypothetical protein
VGVMASPHEDRSAFMTGGRAVRQGRALESGRSYRPFRVSVPGMRTRRWQWPGSVDEREHPRLRVHGRIYGGRKLAWRIAEHEDPGTLRITDFCGNWQCVRHLTQCQ